MKKLEICEITPDAHKCGIAVCPALFETNRDTIIVVGSVLDDAAMGSGIRNKIGEGESAVEIPRKLLMDFIAE